MVSTGTAERARSVNGAPFMKRSWWEVDTLTTVARDLHGKKADFVTKRLINAAGQLVQTNLHGPVSFTRVFTRVA